MDPYLLTQGFNDDLPDAVRYGLCQAQMANADLCWSLLLQMEERRL